MKDLRREMREWWDCRSSEERYYLLIGSLALASFVLRMLPEGPPVEQRMRIRIED